MKVLVPVKRVIDANVPVRVTADKTGIDRANLKMSMNPFDEIAVEEAVRLKEKGVAEEVIAVCIGPNEARDTLRIALAMGADRAVLVTAESDVEPLGVAKILRAICETEKPALVIAGKQAIDDDCGQTGAMLAGLMGWAQATRAYAVTVQDGRVLVECEADNGLQTLDLRLPAVVTTDLRLNEPRYASLPNLMKAKKKPVTETRAAALGIDVRPRITVTGYREPEAREAGVKVTSVGEFVDRLEAAGALR